MLQEASHMKTPIRTQNMSKVIQLEYLNLQAATGCRQPDNPSENILNTNMV